MAFRSSVSSSRAPVPSRRRAPGTSPVLSRTSHEISVTCPVHPRDDRALPVVPTTASSRPSQRVWTRRKKTYVRIVFPAPSNFHGMT
jgi:hypothetical protein